MKRFTAIALVVFMLFGTAYATDAKLYLNGNNIAGQTTFNSGILSAVSEGEGIFAIALYKDKALVSLEYIENYTEDMTTRLNTVIENAEGHVVKVFRFDTDMVPVCINEEMTYAKKTMS